MDHYQSSGSRAVIRPVGIDHIVLRTSQPARLIAFYAEVLGCPIGWARQDLGLVHLNAGMSQIDILDINGPLGREGVEPQDEHRNLEHFCLAVMEFDEPAMRAHLDRHAIDASSSSKRFGATGWGMSFYICDPDGNRIELKSAGPVQET